jgi:type II secretory pathway pseudopilin PulG
MVGRHAPGFTLVELLVATAVTVIALGLAVTLLHPSSVAFTALPEAVDAQQRLRVAVQMLAESVSGAGAGPSLGWGARASPIWPAVLPCRSVGEPLGQLAGGCAQDGAITVMTMGIAAPQAIVDQDVAALDAPIWVAPLSACPLWTTACRLHVGSRALIADGTGAWDVLSISAVSSDGSLFEHAGTPVSRLYAAGAIAGEVESAAYSLGVETATEIPQLRRVTNGSSDLPVLDHVTALRFEYFGAAEAPQVLDDADPDRRRTTYGPVPPPPGVDDGLDTWAQGENCLFARDNGQPVARLVPLPVEYQGLASLPVSVFADGPWCPDPASPNRFDGDLLRIRLVRITLRVQAQSASVRGTDPQFFSHPGVAREAARLVPDLEVHVDVALRNTAR